MNQDGAAAIGALVGALVGVVYSLFIIRAWMKQSENPRPTGDPMGGSSALAFGVAMSIGVLAIIGALIGMIIGR